MTIFQEPLWLNTVAPGLWDEVVVNHGGVIQAKMPFVMNKGDIIMPALTQTLGPLFFNQSGKPANQLSRQHSLMNELIEKLPKFRFFRQNFHFSITNWLPFYWNGFSQTTRYTYVIEDLSNLDLIWNQTRNHIKTDIRKAKDHLIINEDFDFNKLVKLNHRTYERQGLKQPYPDDLIERIINTIQENKCGKVIFAEDSKNKNYGALVIVWDQNTTYPIISATEPELRNSGVSSFLLWEAINQASLITKSFDFGGSMMKSVEAINRGFGAVQKPYFQILKFGSLFSKMSNDVKSWRKFASE